jgi:catechol 2,3-dioxygenase
MMLFYHKPPRKESPMTLPSAPAGTHIGHVHLKVADLERAVAFYRDVMGFDVVARYGAQAAFLSAGGYHHHLGLNTWESAGGNPPPRGATGLYHFAINYPTRAELARALVRLLDAGWGIDGASDHGTHEALYLHDPDFNGIELAWDRAVEDWPRKDDGSLDMYTHPLDFAGLLGTLDDDRARAYAQRLAVYR